MKKTYRLMAGALILTLPLQLVSCSKDDDQPVNPGGEGGDENLTEVTVNFSSVPDEYIGGPTSYGANLYYGTEGQITTGYLVQLNEDVYAQFPVNYGNTFDAAFNPVWGYSYYQGGVAISKYHDMEGDTYLNQLSVYHPLSPSGRNFLVAYGYATDENYTPITVPSSYTLADYADCGRIYITDAQGYYVESPGTEDSGVTGEDKEAYFKSVLIMNTTYAYKTMENGDGYAQALSTENKGWFKVQFIAFDDNDPASKPVGYVEAYLANFDPDLEAKAGYCGKILNDWKQVDLSALPKASVLVINFVGSDTGEFGLNTPTYCALDNFVIEVENDLK